MSDIADTELRRLDMCLLLVFAETVRHRKLTRVAEQLGQTQSSISHVLGRLRNIFGDPLFVRRPNGVEPTERAIALEPRIADILDLTRAALSKATAFDPATATDTVRIAAQDFTARGSPRHWRRRARRRHRVCGSASGRLPARRSSPLWPQ